MDFIRYCPTLLFGCNDPNVIHRSMAGGNAIISPDLVI